MAAAVMPTLKLERSTSSVDASKKPKLSHGAWPPVEVGFEFFVVRDDPKKWPLKTHTSITASAKFMVTARGVRCRELGCPNPGFAEVPEGDVNHASSLHSSDKHVASYHRWTGSRVAWAAQSRAARVGHARASGPAVLSATSSPGLGIASCT
jgi:hypothetical protein